MSVQELLDRLENHYTFECEGGPLRNCVEWSELKRRLADIPVSASPVREAEPKSDDASLRTVVAHPFFALARAFNWDDNQLTAARQLIDITVIRLDEMQAAQQAEIADLRNQNEIMKNADYSFVGTAAEQARIQADADRYRVALEAIRSLDFQKTPNGCDDFYSGAPQFVKAWTLANDALQGPCASPVREAEQKPDLLKSVRDLKTGRLLAEFYDYGAWHEYLRGSEPSSGLREAEPLKALRDYLEDDWPVAVENIRDRCEASVTRFSNDDVSIVVDEYERLRKLCSAALALLGAAQEQP